MLTERNKEIILALAECNMNQSEVSRVKYLHINTVIFHIQKIRENTGLDPKNFYDLIKLVEMAKDGE